MHVDKPTLLADVEAFLATSGMTPTGFGKAVLGDPKFVPQLRKGRRLWPETEQKVRDFMAETKANAEATQ